MGGQLREDLGFLIVILVLVFACNRDDDAVDWKAVQTCLLCWLLGLFLFAILLRLFFFRGLCFRLGLLRLQEPLQEKQARTTSGQVLRRKPLLIEKLCKPPPKLDSAGQAKTLGQRP